VSADRGENDDPTGDISRTDGKGCSKGLTRISGIREQCPWEAQDTASAKKTLQEMQETLRGWYAYRELLVELQAG
jgi:hypothetical protein